MSVGQRQLLQKLVKQQHRCALSGRLLTPENASVDHITPVTRGGGHGIDNLWLVHQKVNIAKGTMTTDEFVSLCEDVVRHHRRHSRSPTALGVGLAIEIRPLPLFDEQAI